MKKSLLFFFLVFTFLSCSKKTESHDADIGRQEDQLVVQEENKATQVESTKIADAELNELETHLSLQENEEDDGKDYTKEYFKDYFEDSITNYEFYIRNPLFIGTTALYFEKPELMKNRILKITKESYEIAPDGNKNWGDSDEKDYSCDYYFFDSDFRITDSYFISRTESGYYFTKIHKIYKCDKQFYKIISKKEHMGKSENSNTIYQIEKKDNTIELYKQGSNDSYLFSKNGITIKSGHDTITFKLIANTINETDSSDYFKDQKPDEYYYENGVGLYQKDYSKTGTYEYTYEEVEPGKYIVYFIENESEEKIPKRIITRRFNPIGFMEYEFTQPYESVEGNYSIMTAEVLDEPDDLFKEAFDESWYD